LSRKSIRPGNASYYYSIPRLATTGRVELFGEVFTVSGLSWLDREWSSSVLDTGQVGWDWFALQLDDGRDIMLYQMRRDDGTVDSTSSGTIVTRDGASIPLRHGDYRIEIQDQWTSSQSGKRYPSGWRIVIPAHDITLDVLPAQKRQELPFAVTYWEGAVRCEGPGFSGRGYVELTGY
jgi:predicted secreted hydrolase